MIQSFSPHDPARLVASSPIASRDEVLSAAKVDAAWASSGPAERAAALGNAAQRLRQRAGEAADLVALEVGKPIGEARGEVARAAAILDFYAQASYSALGQNLPTAGTGLLYTERRPRGVAGLITPWNFPLAIPVWKAAPALACGNTVLLKPSPEAIGCAALLGEVFDGLPFRVLAGEAETGQALIEVADVVSFTGSVEIGRKVVVAAAQRGIPVQAEMGGQNAAIVLADAPVKETAEMLAGAAMAFAGQKCTATSRVIVVGDPQPMTEAFVEAMAAVEACPVINAAAAKRMADAVEEARSSGARVIGDSAVLIVGLPPDHPVAQRETFGPLAVVLPARDIDHAIELANSVPHGLVTSIHGRDAGQLLYAAQRVDTGLIRVNAPTTGVDFYAPFGGEKASSYGPREQGLAALDFYSGTRTVTFGGIA